MVTQGSVRAGTLSRWAGGQIYWHSEDCLVYSDTIVTVGVVLKTFSREPDSVSVVSIPRLDVCALV